MSQKGATSTPSVLVSRLLDPGAYPHPVEHAECVETHISWVLLTGKYAYKIKKPMSLGFLDFSTLSLRHAACLEELRLNRRFAPQLYIDVVPIAGPVDCATVSGAGETVEYAVRMHQFEQSDQLDRLLDAGGLEEADIARAAERIARFHDVAPRVDADNSYGLPASIKHPVEETLRTLSGLLSNPAEQEMLRVLATWCLNCFNRLESTFALRRQRGCVRECHGDLHLGNLVRLGNEVVPFDCIEFSAELRWIDVMSDIGFLMMDLLYRSRTQFAFRLINAYLETCGDYAGVAVLRYYLVYRALVRSMVALLRSKQLTPKDTTAATTIGDAEAHLHLAQQLASPSQPVLFLMHGFSGSGKTYISSNLMQRWPAIRVRSDVERKRLLGLASTESTRSDIGAGAYSQASNEATYRRLFESAATALDAGFSVIVDAASLQQRQRHLFRELATARGVPFVILDCVVPTIELRRRLRERIASGADASEANDAVLDEQLQRAEPLDVTERAETVTIDAGMADNGDVLVAHLSMRLSSARLQSFPNQNVQPGSDPIGRKAVELSRKRSPDPSSARF